MNEECTKIPEKKGKNMKRNRISKSSQIERSHELMRLTIIEIPIMLFPFASIKISPTLIRPDWEAGSFGTKNMTRISLSKGSCELKSEPPEIRIPKPLELLFKLTSTILIVSVILNLFKIDESNFEISFIIWADCKELI